MKILVVDDERALVKGIKFNLENEGYTVDCGYDGNDAVNMAKKNNYDLIILDLMMPGKDGLEACQEIRSFSTVPVIMLTARSERHDLLLGFESGAECPRAQGQGPRAPAQGGHQHGGRRREGCRHGFACADHAG